MTVGTQYVRRSMKKTSTTIANVNCIVIRYWVGTFTIITDYTDDYCPIHYWIFIKIIIIIIIIIIQLKNPFELRVQPPSLCDECAMTEWFTRITQHQRSSSGNPYTVFIHPQPPSDATRAIRPIIVWTMTAALGFLGGGRHIRGAGSPSTGTRRG